MRSSEQSCLRNREVKELGVVGTVRAAKNDDGGLALDRTMEVVPRFRQAGVTDFRIAPAPPRGEEAAAEYLHDVVTAFRSVGA
jgi:hypothetical protein